MRFPSLPRTRWAGATAPRLVVEAGPDAGGDVADDVSAYLDGSLADHLTIRHRPVPAWAALNRVAHADRHELAHLAAGSGTTAMGKAPWRVPPWAEGEWSLAAYVLATCATAPGGLARAQAEVLVPIELAMAARPPAGVTPDLVLEAARRALVARAFRAHP